jgi:cell division protein FtsB
MRIRRSVTRIFVLAVLPAISVAVISYFGSYAIWGERGYLALNATQARLADAQGRWDRISDQNKRLEHRITLLKAGSADPDLIEELARTQLMDGAPGQVAVPRKPQ